MNIEARHSYDNVHPLKVPEREHDEACDAAPEKTSFLDIIDRAILGSVTAHTEGASVLFFATAAFDWWIHAALQPGRSLALAQDAWLSGVRASASAWEAVTGAWEEPTPVSPCDPGIAFSRVLFQGAEAWVDTAVDVVPGVQRRHRDVLRFTGHQMLEPLNPDNFLVTNRHALIRTAKEGGANLVRGYGNFLTDMMAELSGKTDDGGPTGRFVVGRDLATTPGRIVYRNRLFELIQYEPTTEKVNAEPVLITPAWIMKYYILDLTEKKSLVRYLLDSGYTVFMISWKNPDQEDACLTFDDYRTFGVMSALEAVRSLVPDQRIHTVGYCLGGTLLSIALAAATPDEARSVASMTLLAAQTDFQDAGELSIFIDEDQLHFLEESMRRQGFLAGKQMAAAFVALRSRELLWKSRQRRYLLGEDDPSFDLLAWNADTTRMPVAMHTEYLRKLYLQNLLTAGQFMVDGKAVAISDLRMPVFLLGTESDHVAPWKSVFKFHLYADTEVTFALTNGGHNAGVVSPPDNPRRRHRVLTKKDCEPYVAPDAWLDEAEQVEGSWWPTWVAWLDRRSTGRTTARIPARAELSDNQIAPQGDLPAAPGTYVLQT